MGVDKGKTKNTKKLLTKRDKIKKRVARVHKAIARKKADRTKKTAKARSIRRKLKQNQENQVVEMAQIQPSTGEDINAQMNLMNILGLENGQNIHNDWEQMLQRKLKQVDEKSVDNPEVKRVYSQIGKIFTKYRSGKVPKAFKIIPNLEHWRQVILLTRPDQWTSHAMNQAVTVFASNFDPGRAQQFYRTWFVPAIKRDLSRSKKLNVHLFQALKKALYKTNAWFKGILFEFCKEETLMKEAKVMQSLISKMSIPVISASVGMLKLMQMPVSTPIIHYLSAFLNKHYTLPKRVLNTMTEYLLSFSQIDAQMSVIWHTFFLTLVKQYGCSLDELQKSSLKQLCKQKNHKLISPQIMKYLQ